MTLEQLLFDDSTRRLTKAYELCHDAAELPEGDHQITHQEAILLLGTFANLLNYPDTETCTGEYMGLVLEAAESELSRVTWKRIHRGPGKAAFTKHVTVDEVI